MPYPRSHKTTNIKRSPQTPLPLEHIIYRIPSKQPNQSAPIKRIRIKNDNHV